MSVHDPHHGRWKLAVLFFLHGGTLGMWGVSLASVLRAHGFELIVPYAFAATSVAALVSPLAVGALADQRCSSERLLRWLGLGSMLFLALLFWGIHRRWHPWCVLALAQVHAFWSTPTFGLTTSLVLGRLSDARGQFGLLRLWATLGWMGAGAFVSWVLEADSSPVSGWAGCAGWALTVLFTFALPPVPPPAPKPHRSWREVLGLDALHLLRHHDHRVVFVSAALVNVPLAAFYPFTVLHLMDLRVEHLLGTMSLGQITEAVTMISLASLLARVRLKRVFLAGIAFGVARYAIFALDTRSALYAGIFLHGLCYTLFVITAQIYLEQRIPQELRARAQALLTLMMSGIGSLAGTLGCGWWWLACKGPAGVRWPLFWSVLAVAMALVFVFFHASYRGRAADDPSANCGGQS
ncbi:MAG: MFS transporter [Verrucomicrobiaceae bacterium]|nr:MFS transporter [Verrucomicrobiaceae bacterium]